MDAKKINIIKMIFLTIEIIIPILFILEVIDVSIAFPIIFTTLGLQLVFTGLYLVKDKKGIQILSLVVGTIFILFAIGIVIPYYYF